MDVEAQSGGIERIHTFVIGLDEVLGGGIPKKSIVMLAGAEGTMKSSLAYYLLWANAYQNGTKGLYVSFEQRSSSLLLQMSEMGLPLVGRVKGKLLIADLTDVRKETGEKHGEDMTFDMFVGFTKDVVAMHAAELLVVDSISLLRTLMASTENPRKELFLLLEAIRDMNLTAILISEMDADRQVFSTHGEGYLVDGIIHLTVAPTGGHDFQRLLRVVKMRGTEHSLSWYQLMMEGRRFAITSSMEE